MPGQDIFISYSREDVSTTRRFAAAFKQEGFTVWWDDALRSGEAFDQVIEKELRSAKAVVVLWSPRSVASRWVRAEATLADRHGRLAPVVIEPCDRPIIFELTHTVDLCQWDGDRSDPRWQALLKDIHRLVGDGPNSSAEPPPRPSEPIKARLDAASPPATEHQGSPSQGNLVGKLLGGDSVEDLITALSTLRDAMKHKEGPQVPEPHAEAEFDDSEHTQIYTSSDRFDLLGEEVHCLKLAGDNKFEKQFVVTERGVRIGRSSPADIILPDAKVSRTHCLIELKDDELYVLDMNSTNGIYVDGKKVEGAGALPIGSALKVGSYTLLHEKRMTCDV